MKKLLLFAVLIGSVAATAQKGLYIKPTLGFGYSNTQPNSFESTNKGGFAYTAGAQVGYKINHVRFESGVNYISTSGKHNGYQFAEDVEFIGGGDVAYPKSYSNFKQTQHYLTVPMKLGYEAALNNKLSLVPMIGAELVFDLGNSYKGERFDLNDEKLGDFQGHFERDRPTVIGNVGVHVEYRMNRNVHLFCGPTGKYFLSNTFSHFQHNTSSAMPHILTMDMGLLYRF
ncbi:MAG: hypothetical protein EOP51_14210 [Sphingobacteriales bacterium]|nr:MAG: hypothetical protein EOP51_14210 [Sphingobacteriales bacterium]